MLVTEQLKARIKEECLKDLKKVGITDIDKNINAETDLEYIAGLGLDEYVGMTQKDIHDKIVEYSMLADPKKLRQLETLIEIANCLSIYWVLCNGVRFVLDLDSVMAKQFEPTKELMNTLSKTKIEDFVFDFYGDNVREQCRIQKEHDLLRVNGKWYNNYIFSYSRLSKGNQCGVFQICLIPELYPKLFVLNYSQDSTEDVMCNVCAKCKICKQVDDFCYKHTDGSIEASLCLYRFPKNLQHTLESDCEYGKASDEYGPFLKHNIRDYFNACMYVLDKYLNRKTILREKKDTELGGHMKVAVPKEYDPSEVTFVTLRDRVIYEKKRKKSSHSHHASPREHVRRATVRHLKDGRVIEIPSCIINRGKGDVKKQTVYKIS